MTCRNTTISAPIDTNYAATASLLPYPKPLSLIKFQPYGKGVAIPRGEENPTPAAPTLFPSKWHRRGSGRGGQRAVVETQPQHPAVQPRPHLDRSTQVSPPDAWQCALDTQEADVVGIEAEPPFAVDIRSAATLGTMKCTPTRTPTRKPTGQRYSPHVCSHQGRAVGWHGSIA